MEWKTLMYFYEIYLRNYRSLLAKKNPLHRLMTLNAEPCYVNHKLMYPSICGEREMIISEPNYHRKYGDYTIHRLHRINQYDVDYNLILKLHWYYQNQHCEDDHKKLGSNQYGGCKKKRSTDVTFLNEIIIEFHRMSYEK